MDNSSAFHAPLHVLDAPTETKGCRHTNPDICGKNGLSGTCAFVRPDNICKAPPRTWKKQFEKLSNARMADDRTTP